MLKRIAALPRVYWYVTRSGHPGWRALRCCWAFSRGKWAARDAGEMAAQAHLLAWRLARLDEEAD